MNFNENFASILSVAMEQVIGEVSVCACEIQKLILSMENEKIIFLNKSNGRILCWYQTHAAELALDKFNEEKRQIKKWRWILVNF